ncbi:hypothetical protein CBS101457_001387 [Exobasidium rhododendri]|nr:hypothetical protein CBS101457_001387 [Exobasidium rhododendri]
MTAAWYAAAPAPPPSSLPKKASTRSSTSSFQGMHKSSSSTLSLGFDKIARGDNFPEDSHSPEPERPVSRNAVAKVREKERQRARTNSVSREHHQTGTSSANAATYTPDQNTFHQQAAQVQRDRHDSGPVTHPPWSMYAPPPSQEHPQQSPQSAYQQHPYPQLAHTWSHAAANQPVVYGAPPSQAPHGYVNLSWSSTSAVPMPTTTTPLPAPLLYNGHPIMQAHSAQQTAWAGQNYQASVPFPTNNMSPSAVPATYQFPARTKHTSNATPSSSRPLPSPTRSSSQSSSVGTGPGSPSLGSMSGTVRRSLPQPPSKILVQVTATDQGNPSSPLGRHDSVRMAAEEMMSRGPPRRKNISASSRFATTSPTISKSEGTIGQDRPQASKDGGRVARAESASCLEKEMRALKMNEERRKSTSSSHGTVAPTPPPPPPHQRIIRAVSPRPVRAAPPPAPEVSIAAPMEEVIPIRPVSRGPKDERERKRSLPTIKASAAPIPVIFSPPPDCKPPMPSFAFDEPIDVFQPGMPSIVLPGGDDGNKDSDSVPAIRVDELPSFRVNDSEAPMIHVSSDFSEDSEGSEGTAPTKPSISISVSSSSIAQRSTTSTTTMTAGTATGSTDTTHHHPQTHPRGQPRAVAAPASASSIGSGASCATCQKWIGGKVVHAMSHTFHPDCFICCHCSEHLEHVAFYEHEGRPYCHFDYHELFSKRCFHCRTPIVDQRYITINDVDLVGGDKKRKGQEEGQEQEQEEQQAEERCYHDLHFFCANCGDPFLDPKVSSSAAGSDPMAAEMMEDEDGKVRFGGREFIVHQGYPYCEHCHVRLHKPRCKGCKDPILETEFITALKAKWHLNCFCCNHCSQPITSQFYVREDKAYDEECYKIKLRSEL